MHFEPSSSSEADGRQGKREEGTVELMSSSSVREGEFLLQSDGDILAVHGRVSLNLLAGTAPILYKNVIIRSEEALEGLFCERKEDPLFFPTFRSVFVQTSAISRINPFHPLSQVKTLKFLIPSLHPR